jgi:glutathione S-transferase
VIVLRAKQVQFDVTYINLLDKPDWFLEISPHGKVPVLNVDGVPLFESNAIAEFLDEVVPPRLHPADPIKRARNRAWTDFVPDFAKALSGIYYQETPEGIAEGLKAAPKTLQKLEDALVNERGNDGPFFNGPEICLVDAAYAPFLQRFDMIEQRLQSGLLDDFPLLKAWSDTLVASEIVTGSVADSFRADWVASLHRRGYHAASLFEAQAAE